MNFMLHILQIFFRCALSADCMSTEISPNNFATCTEKGETCCAQEDITWLQAVQREDYDYPLEDPNAIFTSSSKFNLDINLNQ